MDYIRLINGITNTLEITEKVLPLIKTGKEPLTKLLKIINNKNISNVHHKNKTIKKDSSSNTINSNHNYNSTLSFFQ